MRRREGRKVSDQLPTETSLKAKLGLTGLDARTNSRAIAAFDHLLADIIDVPRSLIREWKERREQKRPLENAIDTAIRQEQLRRLTNRVIVVEKAVECLEATKSNQDDDQDAPEVDSDWLNYIGSYSEKASSEHVRDLWGRVLAGEIRRPGSFSLSTLRLLAELDQQIASWFEEEVALRHNGDCIIRYEGSLEGDRLTRLQFLEEVGLISSALTVAPIKRLFELDDRGFAAIMEGELALRVYADNDFQLEIIPLTRSGEEICKILPPVNDASVLLNIAEKLDKFATKMSIHRVTIKTEHEFAHHSTPIMVIKPPS